MAFDDDEKSVAGSRPIDLFTIATTSATYRLTSHRVDVVYAGNTYTATTMSRGNQSLAQDLTGRELVVFLPITHPLVQRYAAFGIPDQTVIVTALRLQSTSGAALQYFTGFGQSLSISGHTAEMRCPAGTDDALKIKLPIVTATLNCNHVLFNGQCAPPGSGPDRSVLVVNTVAVSQVKSASSPSPAWDLTVAAMGGRPDGWATLGEAVNSLGERRMILFHSGTTLTLNALFFNILAGDAVTVFPGCDRNIVTCRDKFSNVLNFGGMPQMTTTFQPWVASSGLGVIQQS